MKTRNYMKINLIAKNMKLYKIKWYKAIKNQYYQFISKTSKYEGIKISILKHEIYYIGIKSMTIGKDEPVLYYQTTGEASNQNEERSLLFIHEFKISDHNYISTILSTYP